MTFVFLRDHWVCGGFRGFNLLSDPSPSRSKVKLFTAAPTFGASHCLRTPWTGFSVAHCLASATGMSGRLKLQVENLSREKLGELIARILDGVGVTTHDPVQGSPTTRTALGHSSRSFLMQRVTIYSQLGLRLRVSLLAGTSSLAPARTKPRRKNGLGPGLKT